MSKQDLSPASGEPNDYLTAWSEGEASPAVDAVEAAKKANKSEMDEYITAHADLDTAEATESAAKAEKADKKGESK